jgi:D-tyrosyl-tRNA(Tyr) deacylase
MRALIQRVTSASVRVDNQVIGKIEHGLLVLLGITHNDTEQDIDYLVEKIINLRIFTDNDNKFNLSLLDIKGACLVISQFTLYADTKKGRRPAFINAARPEQAEPLYEKFVSKLKDKDITTATGQFGAYMQVTLVNDGPVTIMLDSGD